MTALCTYTDLPRGGNRLITLPRVDSGDLLMCKEQLTYAIVLIVVVLRWSTLCLDREPPATATVSNRGQEYQPTVSYFGQCHSHLTKSMCRSVLASRSSVARPAGYLRAAVGQIEATLSRVSPALRNHYLTQ
jgi:hypothetical protein